MATSWLFRVVAAGMAFIFLRTKTHAEGSPQQPTSFCRIRKDPYSLTIDGFEPLVIDVYKCEGFCLSSGKVRGDRSFRFKQKRKVFRPRVQNLCNCCQATYLALEQYKLKPKQKISAEGVLLSPVIPEESLEQVHQVVDNVTMEMYYEAHVFRVDGCQCRPCGHVDKPNITGEDGDESTGDNTPSYILPTYFPPGGRR